MSIKERPILFSAPMVQALLDGRKTQTRRVIRHAINRPHRTGSPPDRLLGDWCLSHVPTGPCRDGYLNVEVQCDVDDAYEDRIRCPYGSPGDLLWVRETWNLDGSGYDGIPGDWRYHIYLSYRADDAKSVQVPVTKDQHRKAEELMDRAEALDTLDNWRPSIHMPRWASRLTLRITDVRVQRLQEISEADAIAEGCPAVSLWDLDCASTPPSHHFCALWDSINGAGAWDANPWVWVLTFEVIRANIDLVLQEQAA